MGRRPRRGNRRSRSSLSSPGSASADERLAIARYLFGWQFQGLSDPTTLESIERVNMMHDHLTKRFRASFEKNEDFIYPLVVLMTQGDRMRDIAGGAPPTP